MQIIQQLMKDGTVFCPPFQYQQGTMDLVWCRLSGAATERLVTVDGRAQFGGLVHGEALMLTEDMTPDTAALRREWFAVLLSPEPIRGDSLHARMVVCATRDEALRLAGAIQSGDRRARGYQPGGPALSPTLDLPREIPPFDLAGFLPLPALAPLRDGWDNLLPVPRLEANGNAFVGCVSERQARAVHARANAAGLTKTELYALCRVAFRVADVPHLRSSALIVTSARPSRTSSALRARPGASWIRNSSPPIGPSLPAARAGRAAAPTGSVPASSVRAIIPGSPMT
jgi:hypothetical protein